MTTVWLLRGMTKQPATRGRRGSSFTSPLRAPVHAFAAHLLMNDLVTPGLIHHLFHFQMLRKPDPHARIPTVRHSLHTNIKKGFTNMSVKIYVGNLPYSVTDSSLASNFAEFGAVSSAKVMMDRETGRSKGFGFVEMATAEVAQAAISGLHGVSVDGRSIVVNLARPRESSGGGGGGDGYSSAGYGAKRSDVGYGTGGFGGGRY